MRKLNYGQTIHFFIDNIVRNIIFNTNNNDLCQITNTKVQYIDCIYAKPEQLLELIKFLYSQEDNYEKQQKLLFYLEISRYFYRNGFTFSQDKNTNPKFSYLFKHPYLQLSEKPIEKILDIQKTIFDFYRDECAYIQQQM